MKYKTVKLGEYLYIKGRIGWKGLKKNEYLPHSDYRIINGESLTDDGIDWSKAGYITKERYDESPEIMLQEGDILVSKDGTIGKIGYITSLDAPTTVASGIFVIRNLNPELIDTRFIYNFLCSKRFKDFITMRTEGSVIPHLYQKDFVELDFPLPPIDEQKRIVSILDAISSKIDLNKAINNNLEQQAKEYFKSLFIDFAAYNGEFIDSPIGLIPATMEIDQISNIPHTLETGKRPKGGAVEKGVPSIGAENVKQLGVVDFSSAKFIPEEFAFSMKRGRIYGYEVLLYKDGGKPGTFIPHFSMFGEGFPYETCFINEHVFKLDFGHRGYNEFCYLYLQTDYPFHWLANNGGKAAVPGINQQDVNDIWIPTIHNESVKKFCEWVQPIFTTILSNCSENVKLANIRDSLLSRLLSGEIDVSDIEL